MKPPADRQLNLHGTGTDVPAVAPLRYGVHWSIVFMAATLLALFSSLMAWRFTVSLGRDVTYWRTLVILNTSYWYLWALFTPAIVWLSQHFRFERQGLWRAVVVHLPSVVALFADAHPRDVGRAVVGRPRQRRAVRLVGGSPAVGAPQLRLGNDDLLDDRRA